MAKWKQMKMIVGSIMVGALLMPTMSITAWANAETEVTVDNFESEILPNLAIKEDGTPLKVAITVAIRLPEICPIPIHFIPGIKNSCSNISLENYEAMDIMRGEEVESLAIIDKYHNGSPMILVLPGSHNKFVAVNADKEITGCLTSISGELLSAIINDTIIAKSVNRSFVTADQYDRKWLLLGYNTAKETGLGRACFSGRILGLFCNAEPSKISNYILGAALQGDIQAIRNSSALCVTDDTQFVVCGKDPFKQALVDIFTEEKLSNQITIFEPEAGFSASALGAYLVAEKCKII